VRRPRRLLFSVQVEILSEEPVQCHGRRLGGSQRVLADLRRETKLDMDNSNGNDWTVTGFAGVKAIDITPIAEPVSHLLQVLPGFALS
jgi:hypothetical protein